MSLKTYTPMVEAAVLCGIAFVCHLIIFPFVASSANFMYTIPFLYGFFSACTLVIIFILIRIKQKNIDSVGNTFMLLTCIKMVVAYVLLHPILNTSHNNLSTEKANFFLIFATLLVIETSVAIRMLNKP